MKPQIGDLVIYTMLIDYGANGRKLEKPEIGSSKSFGVITAINTVQDADGTETYYHIGTVPVKLEQIVSKVTTELF